MTGDRAAYLVLSLVLVLSGCLRFYGLGWGTDPQTGAFHRFHPDERTVVESAKWVGEDLRQAKAPYGKAPMYLLWAVARVVGGLAGVEPFEAQDNGSARFTYLLARGISAVLGMLTVWAVFCIGRRLGGDHTQGSERHAGGELGITAGPGARM